MKKIGKTHLVIPDTQVKEGVSLKHLEWLGRYILHKRPDVIVMLGDFADMPSLSSYDKGKKGFEGRRYKKDISAAKTAMAKMLNPITEHNNRCRNNKKAKYLPRKVMLLGNHEYRTVRAVNAEPILEGTISTDDLGYKEFGWEVYDFLVPVEIDGILYSHFFPRSGNGRIVQSTRGAPSAKAQGQREMRSCTAGHAQGLDFSVIETGNKRIYSLIAGSFYLHDEEYLTPQGTNYWKGVIWKNQVINGEYDPIFVSMAYLKNKYG